MTGQSDIPVLCRLEDHPTDPGGWDDLPRDSEYDLALWGRTDPLPPGTQRGTYFKSVRVTEDGREIWTWGRVDPDTLAAGWVAGGGRKAN